MALAFLLWQKIWYLNKSMLCKSRFDLNSGWILLCDGQNIVDDITIFEILFPNLLVNHNLKVVVTQVDKIFHLQYNVWFINILSLLSSKCMLIGLLLIWWWLCHEKQLPKNVKYKCNNYVDLKNEENRKQSCVNTCFNTW